LWLFEPGLAHDLGVISPTQSFQVILDNDACMLDGIGL